MSVEDATLWERWRTRRDADAFAELVSRYSGMVYGTCKRVLRNAADAEDAAQECFLDLMRASVTVRSSLAPWLHTVALRRSRDRIKVDARRRRRENQFAAEQNNHAETNMNDLLAHIDEAIAELPEKLRTPIIHRLLEGRTHADIGRTLGIAESTVRYRVDKGVEQIRKSLKRRGVVVASAVLVSIMETHLSAHAAPATLTAALGKLALSGATAAIGSTVGASGIGIPTLGGLAVMKKAVVAAVIVACVVAGGIVLRRSRFAHEPTTSTADTTPQANSVIISALRPDPKPLQPDQLSPRDESELQIPKPDVSGSQVPAEPVPKCSGSIVGLVQDAASSPIPDAFVRVGTDFRTLDPSMPVFEARTGPYGEYSVDGIDISGTLSVTVSALGYGDAAQSVKLDSNETKSGLDFVLYPGTTLFGKVLAAHGEPIGGTLVIPIAVHAGEESVFDGRKCWAVTDEQGLFQLGFKAHGNVDLQVSSPQCGSTVFSDVSIGGHDIVELLMEDSATLCGEVIFDNGTPLRDYIAITAGIVSEEAYEDGSVGRRFTVASEGRVGPDGSYEITCLAPNLRYVASLRTPAGKHIASFEDISQLIPPGQTRVLNHVLRSFATLAGTVLCESNGMPYPTSVEVRAVPEDDISSSRITWTDEDSAYVLHILQPGLYSVYAQQQHFHNTPFSAEMTRSVELQTGKKTQLDLVLPDPFTIPIKVVYADGEPAKNARLRLCRLSPEGYVGELGSLAVEATTDEEGRYVWHTLGGEEVWVQADKGEYNAMTSDHYVGKAGETLSEIELVLRKPGVVQGYVLSTDGTSASNQGLVLVVADREGQRVLATTIKTDDTGWFRVADALRRDQAFLNVQDRFQNPTLASPAVYWEGPADEGVDLGDIFLEAQD